MNSLSCSTHHAIIGELLSKMEGQMLNDVDGQEVHVGKKNALGKKKILKLHGSTSYIATDIL